MHSCARTPTRWRAAFVAWLALGLIASAEARKPAVVMVGTFDPIHQGHVEVARAARDAIGGRVVILPLVNGSSGKHPLPIDERLAMARRAVRGLHDIRVADRTTVESYIRNRERTLDVLAHRGPLYMLYGADAYQTSVENTGYVTADLAAGRHVLIAPRLGTTLPEALPPGVSLVPGTADGLSSGRIRNAIGEGRHPEGLPPPVEKYIERHHLYERGKL